MALLAAADLIIGLGVDEAEMIPAAWDYAARTILITEPAASPPRSGYFTGAAAVPMPLARAAQVLAEVLADGPGHDWPPDAGQAEGDTVLLNLATHRKKVDWLRKAPHATFLLMNPENTYHWLSLKTVVKREVSEDDPAEGRRVTDQLDRIWVKYTGNEPPYALRDPSMDERRVLFELEVVKVATFDGAARPSGTPAVRPGPAPGRPSAAPPSGPDRPRSTAGPTADGMAPPAPGRSHRPELIRHGYNGTRRGRCDRWTETTGWPGGSRRTVPACGQWPTGCSAR